MLINKHGFFIVVSFYMIFLTLVASSFEAVDPSSITTIPSGIDSVPSVGGAISMLRSLWSLFTFQIEALPFILNLLFVVPIGLGFLIYVIDTVKDIIPFT